MDVQLPDGTVVQGIPDGTTKAQLAEKLKANGRDVPQEWFAPTRRSPMQMIASQFGEGFGKAGAIGGTLMGGSEALKQGLAGLDRFSYAAGGKATDVAKLAGYSPEQAATQGMAANVSLQAIPMLLGGEGAKAVAPAMRSGAEWLMGSALRPSPAQWLSGKGKLAVDTMLEKGLNVSTGGIIKMRQELGDLASKVEGAIKTSPEMISKSAVLGRIQDTYKAFEFHPDRVKAYDAIKQVMTEFINHPTVVNLEQIPVQLAQKLKQKFGQALGDVAYGERKTPAVETVKTITRGLKEEVASKVPEVVKWNAEESRLIKTLNVAERRALMEMNRNPMGLALVTHDPIAAATFMGDKSSLFKSLAARMLNAGKEQIPATATRAGVALSEISGIGQEK